MLKPKALSTGGVKKGGKSGDSEVTYKEFTWPDGGKYEGDWLKGKMHGKGTYVESDGSRYEGQWNEGLMHGKGVQVRALEADRAFFDDRLRG